MKVPSNLKYAKSHEWVRASGDTAVEVDVTLKKYVRAIRGAAPGLVTYRNESTFRVSPEAPDVP